MDIWSASNQIPSMTLRVTWACAYVGFIAVNVGSALGWFGPTNAEVSKKFEVPLTPAGWAFGIWGVIFLLEGFGTVYQLARSGYDPDGAKQRYAHAVGPNWIASWLAAAAWQLAFAQQTPAGMWLAAALISLALLAMARALRGLYAARAAFGAAGSVADYAAFFLPTSINCAWLAVATSVQILIAGAAQTSADALQLQSVLLAAAVAAGGLWALLRHRDTAFGVTLVWALVAVYEHSSSAAVRHATLAATAALLLGCLASVLPRRAAPAEAGADWEARQPLRGAEAVA